MTKKSTDTIFKVRHSAVTQENITLLRVLIFEAISYIIYMKDSLPRRKIFCLKKSALRTVKKFEQKNVFLKTFE